MAQPFRLSAVVNGRLRRHIPDFLCGSGFGLIVVDVVRAQRLAENPKIQMLCEWTREVLEALGWEYRVLSEQPPILLGSVRFLAGYRREQYVDQRSLDRCRHSSERAATGQNNSGSRWTYFSASGSVYVHVSRVCPLQAIDGGGTVSDLDIQIRSRGGRMRIPRSRGAVTGGVLLLLGLWGVAVPFIGPQTDTAFSDVGAGTWTAERGWLQVLPAVATMVGGLLLLVSRNRAVAMLGAWMGVFGGVWFVVGRTVYELLGFGNTADAAATGATANWEDLALFAGLGALIVFLAAVSIGRLSVRSVRDIRTAESPIAITEYAAAAPPDAGRNGHHRSPSEAVPVDGGGAEQRRSLTNLFRRRHSSTESHE